MYACIVKVKIKEKLSDDHQSMQMRETRVPFSLKIERDDKDEKLVDGVSRMRIRN